MKPPDKVEELRSVLASLSLDTRGNKARLKSRLWHHARQSALRATQDEPEGAEESRPEAQMYDSYLVLDVEATCEKIDGPWTRLAFACVRVLIPGCPAG
jgi:3'-5' exoribonuclease 1